MGDVTRKIGLSLGADICWPICYEELVRRLDLQIHQHRRREASSLKLRAPSG